MSDQPNQAGGALEQVYAVSLLDLAWEQGQSDVVEAQLRDLAALLKSDAQAGQLLASRVLSTETRQGIIDRVFKGRVHDLVYRLLQVMNQKGRLDVLPGVIAAYLAAVSDRQGKLDVQAFVATRLNDPDAASLSQSLGQVLGKTVILHQQVDPRLIGGLKIRIADQVIDGSVLTQLRLLREQMITAGREKARLAAASLN